MNFSSPPSRIALVHDWLNGMRGGEKVLEVLGGMFPQAQIFTLFLEKDKLSDTLRRMPIWESPLGRWPGARKHYRWLLPLLPWAIGRFPTQEFDVVISTSHCVAKSAPPPRRGVHVCYCFSPMRYMWDQFSQYFPRPLGGGFCGMGKRPMSAVRRWAVRQAALAVRGPLQGWDAGTSSRVDHFLAISEHVARRIEKHYGRSATVIYPPVDTHYFTPGSPAAQAQATESAATEPYDLVVSALVPYKRVDQAIVAARRLGRRLVVIGSGPERPRLERLAGPGIELRGWASNEEVRQACRGARTFLHPQEEDFGIAALEAQACGVPVIALRRGGACETIRDGQTGLLYDSPTVEGLARALVESEAMTFSPTACRSNAERFGTEVFRAAFEAYVRQCLAQRV